MRERGGGSGREGLYESKQLSEIGWDNALNSFITAVHLTNRSMCVTFPLDGHAAITRI